MTTAAWIGRFVISLKLRGVHGRGLQDHPWRMVTKKKLSWSPMYPAGAFDRSAKASGDQLAGPRRWALVGHGLVLCAMVIHSDLW